MLTYSTKTQIQLYDVHVHSVASTMGFKISRSALYRLLFGKVENGEKDCQKNGFFHFRFLLLRVHQQRKLVTF